MPKSKNGQALIELLVGLIAIVVLLLGLEFISAVVSKDLDNLLDSRSEMGEKISNAGNSNTRTGSSTYGVGDALEKLEESIGAGGNYKDWVGGEYVSSDGIEDGFHALWDKSDPFDYSTGYEAESTKVDVTSPLFREMINREEVEIENKVWMPSWDDLMQ